jgi:hypothetical protein
MSIGMLARRRGLRTLLGMSNDSYKALSLARTLVMMICSMIRNADLGCRKRDMMIWLGIEEIVQCILNMTSVFTVIQDASSLSFKFGSVLSVSSREWGGTSDAAGDCRGLRDGYLSWAKSLGAAHWVAQWARWKTGNR